MASTYRASTAIRSAAASGTPPFFAIYGSASKIVRVESITVSCTVASAAVYSDIVAWKRTATITGGTKTDLTQVPMDSSSSAGTCNIVAFYTANPTAGTGGGAIASRLIFAPLTGTAAPMIPATRFEFYGDAFQGGSGQTGVEGAVLRGIGEGLELSFATTNGNAASCCVQVVWTESPQ